MGFELLAETYKKLLKVKNTDLLELLLATYLSHRIPPHRCPVWLFVIGPSSAGKTLNMSAFFDLPESYPLSKITSRTLISGNPKVDDGIIHLNNKIILISDLSQFLCSDPVEKNRVWSQLREIYDGNLTVGFGTGKTSSYRDLHITLIANSTPIIDQQILLFQQLGTRELMYRVEGLDEATQEEIIMNGNGDFVNNYKGAVEFFLGQEEFKNFDIPDIDGKEKKTILELAKFITIFRATAPVDSYSGELRGFVQKEEPTRVYEMMVKLYKGLILISKDRKRALELIRKVARSTIDPHRFKIFSEFGKNIAEDELTISQMQKKTNLGIKTCKIELFILTALGLLSYSEVEKNYKMSYDFCLTGLGKEWLKKISDL